MLLADHLYPAFERSIKEEMIEQAENCVAKTCAAKLKDLLNVFPIYQIPKEY